MRKVFCCIIAILLGLTIWISDMVNKEVLSIVHQNRYTFTRMLIETNTNTSGKNESEHIPKNLSNHANSRKMKRLSSVRIENGSVLACRLNESGVSPKWPGLKVVKDDVENRTFHTCNGCAR